MIDGWSGKSGEGRCDGTTVDSSMPCVRFDSETQVDVLRHRKEKSAAWPIHYDDALIPTPIGKLGGTLYRILRLTYSTRWG